MADTQIATSGPEGSLPASMINPDTTVLPQPQTGTLVSGLTPPKPSLPQSAFDPVVANLGPKPAPTPAPTAQPTTAPAVAPPTTPQPAPTQQPAAPNQWRAVGDSIARGYQKFGGAGGTGVDLDPNNRTVDAAGGRPPSVVLDYLKSLPDGAWSGQNIRFSTGVSNNPGEINLVPEQLAQLKRLGAANVQVVGVGDRAGDEGGHHYDLSSYNAQLAQDAKGAGMTFGGALPAVVHPAPDYYRQGGAQPQQPPTPGTGKTISDATDYIQRKEGGGPFVLYGHEGQSYDPNSMPTKPGYYGFPDWAGGYGPDGRQTHAAGGAQWEPDTWKNAVEGFTQAGLTNQLGHTPDFRNPDDQKAVFNYWAARRYREQTGGRDIVADLNAGHVDWGSLGSEWSSLKYAGTGGVAGMTAGNLPTYQEYAALSQQQRELLQQEMGTLQKSIAGMEAGDPKQRALADQLMQKQLQLMDKYEDMIAHPPTQKPQDMMSNFGSIATLIGILGGRFAHRPMVASLNAAGAAMQAINDNNYEAYQNSFNQWKTQAGMTSTLLGMESNAYKNIMEDKRLDMDEKFKLLDAQMQVFQNAQGMLASQRGDLDKQWEIAEKTQELADRHDAHVKQLVEANEKQEQDTAIRNAAAEDDRAWLKDHPEANGVVPDSVHFDNLARRRGEISEAGKAPTVGLEKEREVAKAVEADDQAWLAQHPDVKAVPADVHFKHYTDRETQISQTTAAGIRAANNPQALALQKFMEENPGADSKQIQEFIQRMHPGRSGVAMAVTKYMEENPNATSADIANFYASLSAQVTAERNWSTGPLGNTVRSIDVSIDHLATLTDLSENLNNIGSRTYNKIANTLMTEFGDPAVPNFNAAKDIVGAEVTKAIQAGAGALTDREELRRNFDAASTPEQLAGVIATLKRLMAGQLDGLRRQYMQTTGKDDFEEKLSDEAKKELEALSPGGGKGRGGATKYTVGQVIEHGGKKYRVTGGDLNGDPDVEEVQ